MRFLQDHIEEFWRPLWKWVLALHGLSQLRVSVSIWTASFSCAVEIKRELQDFSRILCSLFLEALRIPYIVVARLTQNLKRKAAGLANWTAIYENYAWTRFSLQLQGWSAPREFFAIRARIREIKSAVAKDEFNSGFRGYGMSLKRRHAALLILRIISDKNPVP